MPAVVLPQFLLCGLLVPREAMNDILKVASDVLPLSYAVDAMRLVTLRDVVPGEVWRDLGVVSACILLALVLSAATLRRQSR
jgi:ABC-2 type transport system permease protein